MVLTEVGKPLVYKDIPQPTPASDQVLIKVSVCAVCRTDLHIYDGELEEPKLPLVLGHQIVGTIEAIGDKVSGRKIGERVGVPWLGKTCSQCELCKSGKENLCNSALYTGYQIDGGFAEYCVASAHFVYPIPSAYPDLQAAPLLCAGLIGYRAFKMAGTAQKIGFYGFGSSAHILTQLAKKKGREIYAFTKPGNVEGQEFAKSHGAVWAGTSSERPPSLLDAAIIFAPDGALVPQALSCTKKGGVVICAGIHMSPIPSFSYDLIWGERILRSVANLTRKDGEEFLSLAPNVPIKTEVTSYSLQEANRALEDLRNGKFNGAAVIVMDK